MMSSEIIFVSKFSEPIVIDTEQVLEFEAVPGKGRRKGLFDVTIKMKNGDIITCVSENVKATIKGEE